MMTSRSLQMTVVNHKFENISENIGWLSFKVDRSNLNQVRQNNTTYAVAMVTIFPEVWVDFVVFCRNRTCSLSLSLYTDVKNYG